MSGVNYRLAIYGLRDVSGDWQRKIGKPDKSLDALLQNYTKNKCFFDQKTAFCKQYEKIGKLSVRQQHEYLNFYAKIKVKGQLRLIIKGCLNTQDEIMNKGWSQFVFVFQIISMIEKSVANRLTSYIFAFSVGQLCKSYKRFLGKMSSTYIFKPQQLA
jgi:hypothetical protein